MRVRSGTIGILIILLVAGISIVHAAQERIFVNDYRYPVEQNTLILNDGDESGEVSLQFGKTLNQRLYYDPNGTSTADGAFVFTDDVSVGGQLNMNQNEIKNIVLENSETAPLSPVAGQLYHNTVDHKTYVFNGSIWQDMTAYNTTSSKVVTVGPGMDYASIEAAAGYLSTLHGGMILLSAGIHSVTTAVNLSNITLIGKDATKTTIQISGAGQLDVFDTRMVYLTLDINSINATTAIDIQQGSSSLQFEWVVIDIQDAGDSLMDSTAVTAPTTSITFVNCNESGGSGTILKAIAASNLNTASQIFISSSSGNNLLKVSDWPVTIQGSGNVLTSGKITTIPDNTIVVYPGMNLQAAINSLPNGGSITLLPGTHNITQSLLISYGNIEIQGYGDTTIINASGFSSITGTTGAIQIGAANGTAPVNGVTLSNFKLEVRSNIHGIRVSGGNDNQILNVTVQKMSGQSGSGTAANVGIQLTDSTTAKMYRGVVKGCRVFGNSGTNYFTDGIHVTSSAVTGTWGFNQGINNVLVDGNNVDYVRETSYVFVGVDDSSLFNNRATRMGASGTSGAYGIYMGKLNNVNMNANVFSGSLTAAAIGIGIDSLGASGSAVTNSIFNNNVIDGISNGGAGFTTGFQIGNSSVQVHRNSFQSNTIRGSANVTSTAFLLQGNADDNTISNNNFDGGTYAWTTGINLSASTADRNFVADNHFASVTTVLVDTGTNTQLGVLHHRATTNPAVTDDSSKGYQVGSLWINTSTNASYILSNNAPGAAVWRQIDGSGGTTTLTKIADTSGDTQIQTEKTSNDNTLRFDLGGTTPITDALTMNQSTGFVWNGPGSILNFRVGGSTNANLIFVDATNNRVGIGTGTPRTTLDVDGTAAFVPSTVQNMTAAAGLTVTKGVMLVQGSGGAVTVTATPNIVAGQNGQVVVIQGTSDTNLVTFQDESNLANSRLKLARGLNFTLGKGDLLVLMYNATDTTWYELKRVDN